VSFTVVSIDDHKLTSGCAAFETAANLKSSVQAGLQVLAVDVPSQVFDALIKDAGWVTDDEAWRAIAATFPVGQSAYAQQCRESASKRRADGHAFLLLVAVREERVGLIAF
jgi:translation initiation factor 2-alpha kinase 4